MLRTGKEKIKRGMRHFKILPFAEYTFDIIKQKKLFVCTKCSRLFSAISINNMMNCVGVLKPENLCALEAGCNHGLADRKIPRYCPSENTLSDVYYIYSRLYKIYYEI